jgi:ABC-type sugar transport system ATPase subunit
VALGRAIVREPKAFLLDEPLSNLDPLLRVSTRAELALLHRRLNATMVYVTHDQEEALTLGDRVAVMRDGRIEQCAPPLDVFDRPANRFVAEFVGSPAMNVQTCRRSRSAGATRIEAQTFAFDVEPGAAPGSEAATGTTAGELLVGIRPHDIELTAPGEGDGKGQVAVVEPLGPATLVHVRPDGPGGTVGVAGSGGPGGFTGFVRVVVPSDRRLRVDDWVGLRPRRDRLHFFDSRTGRRLDLAPWSNFH